MTPPPEKPDAQVTAKMWLGFFQFLTPLLRFGSGWFANQALPRTVTGRRGGFVTPRGHRR